MERFLGAQTIPKVGSIINRWQCYTIQDNSDVAKEDYVDLVSYNSEWPKLAQSEIEKLKSVFLADTIIDIQHVGSTAISGLSAKAILDIQTAAYSVEGMKLWLYPCYKNLVMSMGIVILTLSEFFC